MFAQLFMFNYLTTLFRFDTAIYVNYLGRFIFQKKYFCLNMLITNKLEKINESEKKQMAR
jgi:hypothetical protein